MSAARCLVSLLVLLAAAACVVDAQERIKMCGRELIRLAVSSCGNSRLRRSIPEEHLEHQAAFKWDKDASVEVTRGLTEPDVGQLVSSPAPHWFPLSSRIGRAAGTISDICCEKGCSMKELIQFC